MSPYPPFLQSVTLVLGEVLMTALGIGFTSASSTQIRSYAFLLVIASAYLANLLIIHHVPSTLWASVLAGNASTYVLRYLELVLIDRWSYEDGGPTRRLLGSSPDSEKKVREKVVKNNDNNNNNRRTAASLQPATTSWRRRLRFGLDVTLNPRLVNTAYQVKNVPRWSGGEPQQVPPRGSFLRRTALIVLLNYLAVDVSSLGAQPERNAYLFSDQKVALFRRWNSIGPEEMVVRVLASFMLWLNIYCIFRIFHGLIVLLAVGSGSSKVQDWPPPFGPLSEAYSVRRFWGTFWHQNYRDTFGGPAGFIVHDILHLPQGTLVARYARIFTTFFISGALHTSADLAVGMDLRESGSIRFFCTQALGILLEDSVQALYHHHRFVPGVGATKSSNRSGSVVKLIGYLWLGVFLAWSTPVWAYPAMRRNEGRTEDMVLPFSIVKMLAGIA